MKKTTLIITIVAAASLHGHTQQVTFDTLQNRGYYSQPVNVRINNKIIMGCTGIAFSTLGAYNTKIAYDNFGSKNAAFITSTTLTAAIFVFGVEMIREAIVLNAKNHKAKKFKKAINYNNH